jgi:SOS-response transcriptional repressor LexA
MSLVSVHIAKRLVPGAPLGATDELITLPVRVIEQGEIAIRLADTVPTLDLAAGDVLIVHQRKTAASGELVIATREGRAFIGRWWTKHGQHALLDGNGDAIATDAQLVGAVTVAIRDGGTR